jgi:hypothetical protein
MQKTASSRQQTAHLRQAHGGGALALAQGRGVDAGDDDVVAVLRVGKVLTLQDRRLDLEGKVWLWFYRVTI